MNYEINFLILQSQTEKVDKIREEVKKLIEDKGGKITDNLFYKKRKLAYEIKHEQYGFYTVYRFDLESGEVLKDLTKELNLLNTVARHIIVKSDELPALQKEIGKDTTTKQKEITQKDSSSVKTTGKKILDEINKETKQQQTSPETTKEASNEEIQATEKDKDASPADTKEEKTEPAKKTLESKETKNDKTESVAEKNEEKAKEKKTDEKKSKNKKDEISMEDLDKKLDEILDI